MDIISQFVKRFWLCFKSSRSGIFQLDCWPGTVNEVTTTNVGEDPIGNVRYNPTNSLTPGISNEFFAPKEYYTYRSIPQINNDGVPVGDDHNYHYFVLRNKKTLRIKPSRWLNILGITTINRFTGAREINSVGNTEQLFNPASPNFVGYMKIGWRFEPGYGGRENANKNLKNLFSVLNMPITIVNVEIWGNRLLEPLDIIKVDSNNFRITEISGSVESEPIPQWVMNVTGENFSSEGINSWISDEDINRME
jgi:hypothetical protein